MKKEIITRVVPPSALTLINVFIGLAALLCMTELSFWQWLGIILILFLSWGAASLMLEKTRPKQVIFMLLISLVIFGACSGLTVLLVVKPDQWFTALGLFVFLSLVLYSLNLYGLDHVGNDWFDRAESFLPRLWGAVVLTTVVYYGWFLFRGTQAFQERLLVELTAVIGIWLFLTLVGTRHPRPVT